MTGPRPIALLITAIPLQLAACSEPVQPPACGVNLHGDDASCSDGHSDPGELCLTLGATRPIAKHMYRLHNLTLADFNGDKHLDLRIGSEIYTGAGDGTFSETFIRTGGSSSARDVAAGDFNGDGITDLAHVTYDINIFDDPGYPDDRKLLTIWWGNEALDPIKTASFSHFFFEYPVNVLAADFNEDGLDDLAISQISSDIARCDAWILIRDPVLPPEQSFSRLGWVPGVNGSLGCRVAAFDIDDDGHLDLDTTLDEFYAGTGTGEFTPRPTRRPVAVVATHGHDLNCDDIPDAVAPTETATQIWRGLGDGEFKVVDPALSTGDAVATIARFNNDVEPDILVAGDLGLRVLLGDSDFSFTDGALLSTNPGYTELAVADLNEDTHPDIVALGPAGVDIFVSHP